MQTFSVCLWHVSLCASHTNILSTSTRGLRKQAVACVYPHVSSPSRVSDACCACVSPSLWVIRPVGVPTCQAGSSLAPSTPPHWRRLFNTNTALLRFTQGLCCMSLQLHFTLIRPAIGHMSKSQPWESPFQTSVRSGDADGGRFFLQSSVCRWVFWHLLTVSCLQTAITPRKIQK